MLEFCDTVLRDNATRAANKEPPLSYRQAKERWADAVEIYAPPVEQQATAPAPAPQPKPPAAGKKSARPGNQRAGLNTNAKAARFVVGGKTYLVCFGFNKRAGCRNTAKGCGCTNPVIPNSELAHVCNFWDTATSKFCLAAHCREANH